MIQTRSTSFDTPRAAGTVDDDGDMSQVPFNYRYLLGHASVIGGRILDYGCGSGQIVTMGRQRGLDLWGADTYSGRYMSSLDAVALETRAYIRQIHRARAEFPDAHFDLVLSNQVLEHVIDPDAVIADMGRLLKPGGTLIAAFPVISTWYEGHLGLYFAHRLPRGSLRHAAFVATRRLGFGRCRANVTPSEWASESERTLDEVCFYHPRMRMLSALQCLGTADDISVNYMRTRLGNRVRYLPDAFLRWVYHKRAGEIFRVVKAPEGRSSGS